MKRVEVTWVDIQMKGGWHNMAQLDKFISNTNQRTCSHIGYVYEDNDDELVLLDAYFLDKSQFGTIHTIPKGCIKLITELVPTVPTSK
jgi:hypothetical protein